MNNRKIIVSIAIAISAAMAVPPILSSLAAGRAQPATLQPRGAAHTVPWDFQPLTAEMSAAIHTIKSRV